MAALAPSPAALVITTSDGTGRGGVQASIATLAALDCVAVSAVTAVVAPGADGTLAVWELPPEAVTAQIDSALAAASIRTVVTGRLGPAATVDAVATAVASLPPGLSVVVSGAGRGWEGPADPATARRARDRLLPSATLLVADARDVRALLGVGVGSLAEQRTAARLLHGLGPAWILLRGRGEDAQDLLTDGHEEHVVPRGARSGGITAGSGSGSGPARPDEGSGERVAWAAAARLAHGAFVQDAVAGALGWR